LAAGSAIAATRLVMMTPVVQQENIRRFEEIGFAGCLIKPVRQSDLLACMASVLAGEAQAGRCQVPAARSQVAQERRRSMRILLVEDNRVNQMVGVAILKRLGLQVTVASNGKEALRVVAQEKYHLVLMDVQMPEMDGYEATGKIRGNKDGLTNPDVPIIAMTGHAMKGDAEKCLDAGMNDYVSKPVDPKVLAEVVEKWLAREEENLPASQTGVML